MNRLFKVRPVRSPGAFTTRAQLVLVAALLPGCASYFQELSTWNGRSQVCEHAGIGYIGIRMAAQGQDTCLTSLGLLGYVQTDAQGEIGVQLGDDDDGPGVRVLAVETGSPASANGMLVGDRLVSVDGQRIDGLDDAARLLFGPAGTRLSAGVQRGEEVVQIDLVRAMRTDAVAAGRAPGHTHPVDTPGDTGVSTAPTP